MSPPKTYYMVRRLSVSFEIMSQREREREREIANALLVVCFAFMYIFVYVLLIRHLGVSSWHVVYDL